MNQSTWSDGINEYLQFETKIKEVDLQMSKKWPSV